MQVACQHCATQYEVEPSAIPAAGYYAQCTQCQQTFFVPPPGAPTTAYEAPVAVTCDHCGVVYQMAPSSIPPGGYQAQCTQCQQIFTVPSAEDLLRAEQTPEPPVSEAAVEPSEIELEEHSFEPDIVEVEVEDDGLDDGVDLGDIEYPAPEIISKEVTAMNIVPLPPQEPSENDTPPPKLPSTPWGEEPAIAAETAPTIGEITGPFSDEILSEGSPPPPLDVAFGDEHIEHATPMNLEQFTADVDEAAGPGNYTDFLADLAFPVGGDPQAIADGAADAAISAVVAAVAAPPAPPQDALDESFDISVDQAARANTPPPFEMAIEEPAASLVAGEVGDINDDSADAAGWRALNDKLGQPEVPLGSEPIDHVFARIDKLHRFQRWLTRGLLVACVAYAGITYAFLPRLFDRSIGRFIGVKLTINPTAIKVFERGLTQLWLDTPAAYPDAIRDFSMALKIDPAFPDAVAYLNLARIFRSSDMQQLAKENAGGQSSNTMKEFETAGKELAEAHAALRIGDHNFPKSFTICAARVLYGQVDAEMRGGQDDPMKPCQDLEVAALHLEKGAPSHNPLMLYAQGMVALAKGDKDAAEQSYRAALTAAPLWQRARYSLAQALIQQNKVEDAKKELAAILQKNPDHPRARHQLDELNKPKTPAPTAVVAEKAAPAKPAVLSKKELRKKNGHAGKGAKAKRRK